MTPPIKTVEVASVSEHVPRMALSKPLVEFGDAVPLPVEPPGWHSIGYAVTLAGELAILRSSFDLPARKAWLLKGGNGLNQYTGVAGAAFTYDANGNLTSDGTTAYTYDVENRLIAATGDTTLIYDPLGRLSAITKAGSTTRFLHDGDQIVAEYDGAGTMLRRYAHGPADDDPLALWEGPTMAASVRQWRTNGR